MAELSHRPNRLVRSYDPNAKPLNQQKAPLHILLLLFVSFTQIVLVLESYLAL